jgi:hypothetical protein
LSGWLNELAQDNPNNPLIAIPAGTLVGPAALLDGTVFRGIHASACERRRGIKNTIAKSHDPIQKGVGVIALGYGYVGEGFAMFGAAEGASAPISAGIGIAFAPVVAVRTPYGTAIQSSSAAAMETRVAVQQGATVFKGGVFGQKRSCRLAIPRHRMSAQCWICRAIRPPGEELRVRFHPYRESSSGRSRDYTTSTRDSTESRWRY